MKAFHFPLSRVLDWRAMQARIEESKLETLYAELRAIDQSERSLQQQRQESEQALLSAPAASSGWWRRPSSARRSTPA